MPTFRHGKNTNFQIQDSTGNNLPANPAAATALRDISTSLRTISFPRPADMAETSAFQTVVKSYVVGLIAASLSFDGMFDATTSGYLDSIVGLETARMFVYGPEGSTAGRVRYWGFCYLQNYEIGGSIGAMVDIKCSGQITGAVTRDTY